MGLGMTFTSVTAAMINQLLTKKVVMGLQLSILWGNTLAEWENMVQNDFPGIISKERKWYPLRRHNSVPRLLIEIQKTPPQGRPALSFVAEPILVVTMPAVAETFKSVIDEMIFATDFQLINLWHAENVNLTHKDLNTSLDEPENRCSIHLVSYNTFLSRVKPSSNGQLSHCSWSFGIFDESHPSAKNISARVEWQRKSGQGPSEPSETPRWRITPCPASIPRIALHNTLRSPFNLSSRSFYVKLEEHRNKVRRYDTTRLWGSTPLREATKSRKDRVRAKVGIDWVCNFVVWQDEMKMICCLSTPGSPEYILRIAHSTSVRAVSPYTHRPNIYSTSLVPSPLPLCLCTPTARTYTPRHSFHLRYLCISIHPLSFLNDILGGRDWASLEMHLESEIEWTERCTWRPWSIEFGDALGGRDGASLEMHLETKVEWTQRCTFRPWLSEFGDAIEDRDGVNSEMHLGAVRERV